MQVEIKQNFSIFKRISSAVVIILVVVLSVNLWQMHNQSASQWYQFESEQLGRSLTVQAAKLVSPPMQNQQQELLDFYVDMIEQDEFVKGAVIFKANGERLHSQTPFNSVVEAARQTEHQPLVFVENIVADNGSILGYIKIMLDREQVTIHHRAFVKSQLTQIIITMILTFIVAMLFTRLFYKFRYRHFVPDDVRADDTELR